MYLARLLTKLPIRILVPLSLAALLWLATFAAPAAAQEATPTSTRAVQQQATATPGEATSAPSTNVTQFSDLELDITVDAPAAGSGEARMNVFLESAEADWPDLVRLRITLAPQTHVQQQQVELDGQPIDPATASTTELIYDIPAPGTGTAQQIRRLALIVILWPGAQDVPVPMRAELLTPDGELITTAELSAAEQLALALGRPAVQQQEPTTAPTQPALPTATPPPPATDPPPPLVEAPPAQVEEEESNLNRLLLFGVLIVAALLLLFLAAYLAYRLLRRPAAQPATRGSGPALTPVPQQAQQVVAEEPPGRPFLTLAGDSKHQIPINTTRFTIGRAEENDLALDDAIADSATVSRHHALIYRQGNDYVIEDLNSRNGVLVNGRATPKNVLQDGSQVTLGGVTFTFHSAEPPR